MRFQTADGIRRIAGLDRYSEHPEYSPGISVLSPLLFPACKQSRQAGKALASQIEIARAREAGSLADSKSLPITVKATRDGYLLEAWLPASVLTGFDPEATPRIGFYYYLRDSELGEQFLTVGDEFPFANDPSLWTTLELVE